MKRQRTLGWAGAVRTAPAAAVPVAEGTGTGFGDHLGWLLLVVLLGGTVAVTLISRSRRVRLWSAEASALAAESRSLTQVRLPTLLTARTVAELSRIWSPIRHDLIDLAARWGNLAGRATDDGQRATAGTATALLRDLVSAIDAQNEALASGREWHRLRPQVDAVLDALSTLLPPRPGLENVPGPAPYPA